MKTTYSFKLKGHIISFDKDYIEIREDTIFMPNHITIPRKLLFKIVRNIKNHAPN